MSDSLRKKKLSLGTFYGFLSLLNRVFLFNEANVVSFRKRTMSNFSAQARGFYFSELAVLAGSTSSQIERVRTRNLFNKFNRLVLLSD